MLLSCTASEASKGLSIGFSRASSKAFLIAPQSSSDNSEVCTKHESAQAASSGEGSTAFAFDLMAPRIAGSISSDSEASSCSYVRLGSERRAKMSPSSEVMAMHRI
jgi:hypothetical protein